MTATTTTVAPPSLSPAQVQLHDYQQVVKNFMASTPHCATFLPMGLGKTLVTLDTLNTVMPQGHILVIAPLNIVRSTWIDEIEKWGYNVRTKSLIVNEDGKSISRDARLARYKSVFEEPPTMYFVNQDLVEDLVLHMGQRYNSHMMTDLLDFISGKVSPELDAKIGKKFSQRNDAKVTDDLIGFLKAQAKEAGDAAAVAARIDPDPKVQARSDKRAQRLSDLVIGLGNPLYAQIEAFPDQWAAATGKKLHPAIWPFQTVIIDESQGFKNPSSRRFKHLQMVRPAITRLIEMTGTPTPQGLLDLWAQVFLLDQGQALGTTMSEYKKRWFYETKYVNNRPVAWEPRPGAEQEIYDAVRHLVMSVENTSLQLPSLTINDVMVHLDHDEMQAYRKFAKESVIDLATVSGDKVSITAASAGVLTAKLTQFASGTMYVPPITCVQCRGKIMRSVDIDDDDQPIVTLSHEDEDVDLDHAPKPVHQHQSWEIVHGRKMEHLDYILRNTPTPTIVAYRFVSDRKRLMKELAELGHDVHLFDGSREMIQDWNAGKYPVMLLQPASAGHGLNLQQGGSTLVWYTLPTSLEQYLQTNARLHRQGQVNPVVIHRLIAKGTYDERVVRLLANKKITQDDLIEAVMMDLSSLDIDPEDIWLTAADHHPDDDVGFDVSELL